MIESKKKIEDSLRDSVRICRVMWAANEWQQPRYNNKRSKRSIDSEMYYNHGEYICHGRRKVERQINLYFYG